MGILDLISAGESKSVDFKRELPTNKDIAKTIVAFANTAGGQLIIGVNDDRSISGIDEESVFELKDKIASIVADSCSPNILPEIYTVNIEKRLVLVIKVSRGNLLPYYMSAEGKDGGTYIRVGATTRKASPDYIADMERQRQNISYDEDINYEYEIEDLDISPLEKHFEQAHKVFDHQKMKSMKLIKTVDGKDYPTNGLLILLGGFDHCVIKFARFKGNNMDFFLDRKEYSGDLIVQLEDVLSILRSHLKLRGEVKGLYMSDELEIPSVALREALVNAVVHRDYVNHGRDVKVALYDDTLKITSPGSFPNTITFQDIEEGRSEVRNKVLARVFKELNLIEQWGSGIARIKSSCFEQGLEYPKISEKSDSVSVLFTRLHDKDRQIPPNTAGHRRIPPDTAGYRRTPPEYDAQDHEVAVLDYIEQEGSITNKKAQELLELKESRIKEIFREMRSKELIDIKGRGSKTYYVAK